MKTPVRQLIADHTRREVRSIGKEAPVAAAVEKMTADNVGSLCVIDADRLIGIFTERDLMARVVAVGRDPDRTLIEQVMTPDPVCIAADASVGEALQLLDQRDIRHLPVVDDDRLIGMVSLRDVADFVLAQQDMLIERAVGATRVSFG